jgi:hypothetical protein
VDHSDNSPRGFHFLRAGKLGSARNRKSVWVSYRFGDYIDVTTIQPGDTLRVILSDDGSKITKMMYVQEPQFATILK